MSIDWPVLRKVLKSSVKGWRDYPVYCKVNYSKKEDTFKYITGGEALYSSTIVKPIEFMKKAEWNI